MTIAQAIVLGIIQGITEFVPVSSSGHLVIVPNLLGWQQPSVSFDVLLHFGTLLAAVIYFRADIQNMIHDLFSGRTEAESTSVTLKSLIISTAATLVVVLLIKSFAEEVFSEPRWAAFFLIVTAFFLWASERFSKQEKTIKGLNIADSLYIGFAQGLAVFPGLSRSGSTISAALSRGVSREESANYSFLLAIPIISIAVVWEMPDLYREGFQASTAMFLGFAASAVSGYLAIRWMMRILKQQKLYMFAIYCLALGLFSLYVL